MTMQTTTLPFQVSGANAPTPRTASAERALEATQGNGSFGATLSREVAARQQPQAQAPAPAAQQAKPAPQQASKPAAADKQAAREPVREGATRATVKPAAHESEPAAKETASADGADVAAADAAAAAQAAAAATTPVTDMLAFMASLTQPATAAATVAVAAGTATTAGDQQLKALASALERMTGATAVAVDDAAAGASTTTDTTTGFTLAAGVQTAPDDGAVLQTPTQGQAAAALPQGEQDAAVFQAQLRETQQQTTLADDAPAPLAQLQAQAAKIDAAGNPAAVPGDRIPARVGTQAWDNQVAQRIVYMVGKEQAATLTLNPPDLGPVQIVLNVSNDQATVAFSSQQLEVRQALENAMPRLREMMSESGIALGNATVDANVPDQRQQQDSERRAQGGNGGAGGLSGAGTDAEPAVNEVAPRTRTVSVGGNGTVDLFA